MFQRSLWSLVPVLAALFLPFVPLRVPPVAPGPAEAATITVNSTLQGPGVAGFCTLGAAILAANTDSAVDGCAAGSGADTIILPPATYTLTVGNATPEGPAGLPSVISEITILGAGAATTIIQRDSGAPSFRIFHVASGSLTLNGVTVRGGDAGDTGFPQGNGGAILVIGGPLTINNSILSSNTAGRDGGAISNSFFQAIMITNSTLSGNAAANGFGGAISNFGPLRIDGVTFSGNNALSAAAIDHFGGTLTLTNSTLSGNTAVDSGGGLVNGGTASLSNSTLSGNAAFNGFGGGIFAFNGTVSLNNVTIANNVGHNGGGLALTSDVTDIDFGTVIHFKNTILAGNTASGGQGPDCFLVAGTLNSQGHNLIQDTSACLISGDPTGNITGVDPKLAPLGDNGGPAFTHALLAGGPAIDAGDRATPGSGGTACEATDERAVARPQGAACDIGAYELQGGGIPPLIIAVAEAIRVSDGPALLPAALITLTETIRVRDTPTVIPPAVIAVAEAIRVSDRPALLPSAFIALTETVRVRDAPGVIPPALITVAEAIRVRDRPALLPAALIMLTETIRVRDTPTVVPPALITVAEAIRVSDRPTLLPSAFITLTETISVRDTARVLPPSVITVAEAIRVRDRPRLDLPTAISVNDVRAAQGSAGTAEAVFTVSLSSPSGKPVTVKFDTADGTAKAGSDYVASSGMLTFKPRETTKTITIEVNNRPPGAPDKTFFVNLTNSPNATIARAQGVGTIAGDALRPRMAINDVSVLPGNARRPAANFTVRLSKTSDQRVTVDFATADGTASAGSDYVATSGTLTFSPGETSHIISVALKGDSQDRASRTFVVDLTNPTNATFSQAWGTGTIMGDDMADLSVTQTGLPDPAVVGEKLTYTVAVRNGGPGQATGVRITDTLPPSVTLVSAKSSVGTCTHGAGSVTCDIGNLRRGDRARLTITVTPTTTGTITNTVVVEGNEKDPKPESNMAVLRTRVYSEATLAVPLIAVINRDAGSVSFIDPETNLVVGTVELPREPVDASFLDAFADAPLSEATLYVVERGTREEERGQTYTQDDHDGGRKGGTVRVVVGGLTPGSTRAFGFALGTMMEVGNSPEGLAMKPDGSQVWVANYDDDSILIIDPENETPISTVLLDQREPPGGGDGEVNGGSIGQGPVAVGFSPDGAFAYVVGRQANTLTVLDVEKAVSDPVNAVQGSVQVGNEPVALAVNPAGSMVYVVNRGDNAVAVVDVSSPGAPVLQTQIVVGRGPQGIALLADESRLYVTNSESNTVSVLDVGREPIFLTEISEIAVGQKPSGIAVTRPGTFVEQPFVYVANREDHTVSVISTSNNQVIATIPVGKGPTRVAAVLIPTAP